MLGSGKPRSIREHTELISRRKAFFCYLKGRGPLKKSKKFAANVEEVKAHRLIQLTLPLLFHFTVPLRCCRTEAKFMDEIQTKVFRVIFLLVIHSHLYIALLEISISSNSRNLNYISRCLNKPPLQCSKLNKDNIFVILAREPP